MKYGDLPVPLGIHTVECNEMMFYQDMPIKFPGIYVLRDEQRLTPFNELIGICCCDYIGVFGLDNYMSSYVYLSAKHLFQSPGRPFNRPGYHSDGYMTPDINYIWCNKNPTIFNVSDFKLTADHAISIEEMEQQALVENEFSFRNNELLRLNQFNIHKVSEIKEAGMRLFLKVSFSKEKYDLIGNTHNYGIEYIWDMRERQVVRNNPSKQPE